MIEKPLDGLLVLEFSQFMAGPSSGLKLADMGARVIKIERPTTGEGGRKIAIKSLFVDGDSLVFHTINRNKESYAADLKNEEDLARIKKLIEHADVITHNFRPGVMEKIGLDYNTVRLINPQIVYGIVTGYGNIGPWAKKPGQDLLVQSLSGLTWLSGTKNDGPVPFGLAVIDMYCATHFTQGILAALLKRDKTKKSVLVEVSLMESAIDMQFEVLTTHLNDGGKLPPRSAVRGGGHAYLSAPYGVYKTKDTYLSLAMGDVMAIANAIGCDLTSYSDKQTWFSKRDEIVEIIGKTLKNKTTQEWLTILEENKIWCAEVLDYTSFLSHDAYTQLEMKQNVKLPDGKLLPTTRSPLHINGNKLTSTIPAPQVGVNTALINKEFNLLEIKK
jgi:crotonobetainyl-CoA:carnitine CoA-transferase CaiB-like acyl-CoA transferase